MLGLTEAKQAQIIQSINKHFVVLGAVLLVSMFIAQFIILATVGTKGAEISKIQEDKQYYRIENERLRAQIDEARTLDNVQENVGKIFDLEQKSVESIRVYSGNSDDTLGYANQ